MSLTLENVTPIMYKVKGQMIPGSLSLAQRITFAQGLGLPQKAAEVIGMQDRAASLIGRLQTIIEQTNDYELQEKANALVNQWNTECDAYLSSH